MNYTKGKWEVKGFAEFVCGVWYASITSSDKPIAKVRGDNKNNCEANAHLIAASPNLYEALKEAHEWLTQLNKLHPIIDDGDFNILQRHIQKALAKAEGKNEKR